MHCESARPEDTDWKQIVQLYDLLERVQPSPVVSLNRAVAVAMADGPKPALELVEALAATNDLENYHLLHAARADLLRRLGFWMKPPRAMRGPWNWSPTKASAAFCSGVCAKFSPRRRDPLVACRSEFVTTDTAGGVEYFHWIGRAAAE